MTGLRRLLEDFDAPANRPSPAPAEPGIGAAQLEAEKAEAYESGHRAGWDDAVNAQTEEGNRISSALAQNLQDLSFTYNEAYSHVMNAMAPLLEEMVSALLPGLAREALAPQVLDQLLNTAREAGSVGVIIAVAPGATDSIAPLLERDFGFPITLEEDDTLTEGQADLRFGETERQVDLTEALETIAESVRGFVHDNRRMTRHG